MSKPRVRRRRLFLWGAATLLVMGAIFFFSSQPASDSSSLSELLLGTRFGQLLMRLLPPLSEQGDSHDIRKYAHMTEYLCLGICALMFFRELTATKARGRLLSVCVSWPFCLLYACTDEFHQLFVEGRCCSLADVGIDGIGFTVGILASLAAAAARRSKTDNRDDHPEGGT